MEILFANEIKIVNKCYRSVASVTEVWNALLSPRKKMDGWIENMNYEISIRNLDYYFYLLKKRLLANKQHK